MTGTSSQNQIYFPVVGGASSSSSYGFRKDPFTGVKSEHKGIDYGAPIGTEVVAIKSGTITRIGWENDDNHSQGFGQRISIKYDDGSVYEGFYGHLSGFANGLTEDSVGVKVNAGQIIGYVGSTGSSTGPHLHYEEAKFENGKKEPHDPSSELSNATIINKDGSQIPANSTPSTFTTIINFFTSIPTSISDFFNSDDAKEIINSNPLVSTGKIASKLLVNVNQESSYTIKSGDSLSAIATQNNTTVDKLLELNPNIENPNLINAGDTIIIPVKTEEHSFNTYKGDQAIFLADSGMIRSDALSPLEESIIKLNGSSANDTITLVPDDLSLTLKDDTVVKASSLIEMFESAKLVTANFISGYMGQVNSLLTTNDGMASLISDVSAGIERGDSKEDIAKFIATKLAVRQLLDQGSTAIRQEIEQVLMDNAADIAAIESGNTLNLSKEGIDKLQTVESVTGNPAFKFGYTVAIAYATTILLNMNEGWDSAEYTRGAVDVTAQVTAQYAVSSYFGGSAAGAGVGAAAAYMVSAGINDLRSDDHMDSHQWQSTMASAAVIGAAAAIGFFAGGPVGAVVATIIVSQFMGGKEYGEGEYGDPSLIYKQLYQITTKADGTGLEIIGIGNEGVTLKASQSGVDDIYGSNSSDSLVGNDQNNVIIGSSLNDNGVDHDIIEGKGGDDIILGKAGNDHIEGGDGNDTIDGGTGNDRIIGGNGNDQIIGGDGDDIIEGNNGDDQIDSGNGDDTVIAGDGNDTIISGSGSDNIDAGAGDDVIFSENDNDLIRAGAGNDQINSGAGDDEIYGEDGNDNITTEAGDDIIFAGSGVDIINSGLGNDIVDGGADNDLVLAGLGNDVVYGNDGDDTISGELGNDYLMGGAGNDIIDGGEGDDILIGNTGNDVLKGGAGNDLYLYNKFDGATEINEEQNSSNNDVLRIFGIANTNELVFSKDSDDLVINFTSSPNDKITVKNQFNASVIEKLRIDNGTEIDLTSLSFNGSSSSYNQSTYNEAVDSNKLQQHFNNLLQDKDNQVIYNPNSSWYSNNYDLNTINQQIDYTKYNEVEVRSYKAKRSIFGGYYNVYYKYYETNLSGTALNDKIVGSWWGENIYGGAGNDQLYGGDGNDAIYGGDDNDLIYVVTGNDVLHGQNGTDKVYGDENDDKIEGNNGNDTLYGDSGNDTIAGADGDDLIFGGKVQDYIRTDTLMG